MAMKKEGQADEDTAALLGAMGGAGIEVGEEGGDDEDGEMADGDDNDFEGDAEQGGVEEGKGGIIAGLEALAGANAEQAEAKGANAGGGGRAPMSDGGDGAAGNGATPPS
jgi:hypothetical protein